MAGVVKYDIDVSANILIPGLLHLGACTSGEALHVGDRPTIDIISFLLPRVSRAGLSGNPQTKKAGQENACCESLCHGISWYQVRNESQWLWCARKEWVWSAGFPLPCTFWAVMGLSPESFGIGPTTYFYWPWPNEPLHLRKAIGLPAKGLSPAPAGSRGVWAAVPSASGRWGSHCDALDRSQQAASWPSWGIWLYDVGSSEKDAATCTSTQSTQRA
jgi:hypothetical protein